MNPAVFAGVIALLIASRTIKPIKNPVTVTSGAVIAVLVWIFVGPLWLIGWFDLVRSIDQRDWTEVAGSLALVGITTLVLFPWPITRDLLIPLGRPKLAWLLSHISFWAWRGDVRGGAMIAAALAMLRREPNDPRNLDLIAWAEQKLGRSVVPTSTPDSAKTIRWTTGGSAIVATGLLAAVRGDRRVARQLLASASELIVSTRPDRAVVIANEWLCADAIERGDWREVEFVARTSQVDSPTLRLLASVAARLTGIAPLPNDLVVRVRWWLAPRRRAMRPLVHAALATPMTPRPRSKPSATPLEPIAVSGESAPTDLLAMALRLHVALLRLPTAKLDTQAILQVGAAWDRALTSDELEAHVRERALALASRSDHALRTLVDQVEADLCELVVDARLSLVSFAELDGLLARVARRLHGELLDALEVASGAIQSRVDAKRALSAIDEWQSFLVLREQHANAVALGGLDLRRLAFGQLHGPVCGLAVWLWNERSERALGNAIFQWLLDEAIVVDDAEAIRLQEKNVGCGI